MKRPVADNWPVTLNYGPSPGYPNATQTHLGKDYGCPVGTPVWFQESGTVVNASLVGQLGLYAQIESDAVPGRFWGLAHLSRCDILVGQHVAAGEVVGASGGRPGDYGAGLTTGPHLHTECRIGSQWGDRIDPDSVVLEDDVTDVEKLIVAQAFWDLKSYFEGPQTKARRADAIAALLTAVRQLKGEE